MTRLLRAFVWLRWRLLVNSLRGGKRRDALERFSRAAALIVPLVLGAMLVPITLGLAAGAAAMGWSMGRAGEPQPGFLFVSRLLLGILTAAILISPIVRSVQSAGTGSERFTLLPIPRRLLHGLEMISGLADPWILVLVPALLALPAGLLAAGAPGAAAAALAAGLLYLAALLGLASLLSNALQWIYRSRRRGEVVTLIVLIGISLAGFTPMLVNTMVDHRVRDLKSRRHSKVTASGTSGEDRGAGSAAGRDEPGIGPPGIDERGVTEGAPRGKGDETAASRDGANEPRERSEGPPRETGDADEGASTLEEERRRAEDRARPDQPAELDRAGEIGRDQRRLAKIETARRDGDPWVFAPTGVRIAARTLPSELYVRSLGAALRGQAGRAILSLSSLLLIGCLLYTLSWTSYRRVLETPPSGASGHGVRELRIAMPRFPWLGPGASAVAYAYLRATLRTVQGKMILFFSPIAITIALIFVVRTQGGRLDMLGIGTVAAVLWIGAGMGLLSLQKMLLNQFAIDRAGFTMQVLSPLSPRDLVAGKAAGMGVLYTALFSYFMVFAAVAGGSAPLLTWIPPILGAASSYLLYAPIAATLSALFPRSADLNRMGSGGNPSGLAAFLGLAFVHIVLAPPALLGIGSLVLAKSPLLAVVLTALWALAAVPVSILLMRLAARTLGSRMENVALVAQGR